jgi:hypothetical protein
MNKTREQLNTRLGILFEMLINREITIEKYTEIVLNLSNNNNVRKLF